MTRSAESSAEKVPFWIKTGVVASLGVAALTGCGNKVEATPTETPSPTITETIEPTVEATPTPTETTPEVDPSITANIERLAAIDNIEDFGKESIEDRLQFCSSINGNGSLERIAENWADITGNPLDVLPAKDDNLTDQDVVTLNYYEFVRSPRTAHYNADYSGYDSFEPITGQKLTNCFYLDGNSIWAEQENATFLGHVDTGAFSIDVVTYANQNAYPVPVVQSAESPQAIDGFEHREITVRDPGSGVITRIDYVKIPYINSEGQEDFSYVVNKYVKQN